MKKIFLLLLTLISVNVQAENKYTDFEFKELVEKRQNDDEFNKYVSTTFNKFYKPIEVDTTYIEGLDTTYFTHVDPTDFQIDEYLLEREPIGYPYEGFITIESGKNYLTNHIVLEEAYNFEENISKLEAYHNETPIDVNIEIDTINNKVNIYFNKDYYVNEIKLIFNYNNKDDYNFNLIFINKDNLNKRTVEPIKLAHSTNKVTLYTLKTDDYIAYIRKNKFSFKNRLYTYYFTVTRYKHYNIQKEYYIDSEEETIDGYIFDPTESYTMYRHYTRELLEPPTPPIENIPVVEEKPNEEMSKEENPSPEIIPEKPQVPVKEEQKKVYTNIPNKKYNSSNKVETTEKEENVIYPAVVDTTKNEQSITNLENKKDEETKNSSETEEPICKTKTVIITILLSICLVLILIDTIFSGIDLIKSVKKRR